MSLLKKIFISLILCLSFLNAIHPVVPVAYAQNQEIIYVASRKSNKYHYPDCRAAKMIYKDNLVGFESKDEAEAAGYVACKLCRP